MKHVTLCADDFAMSPAGSQRIIELIKRQRLSATSVMSQSAHWPLLANELRDVQAQADIGLHFNLTEAFSAAERPLSQWLLRSQLRWLNKDELRERLLAQIDLFAEHFGRLPDFIDGHQHVHAFPVIRQALFEAINLRWHDQPKPYVRAPDQLRHSGDNPFKARVLTASCYGFSQAANTLGLSSPDWFAGLYSLTAQANYSQLMQTWLAAAADNALIMCHPGVNHAGDEIGPAREMEFGFFSSAAFAEQCQAAQVCISRYKKSPAS